MSDDSKKEVATKRKLNRPSLPDFDTLRDMARNRPDELEALRIALCEKVIDEAPAHAKQRLKGLMFQINAKRKINESEAEANKELADMMNQSLQRMQGMLKDLRTMQSESILLATRRQPDRPSDEEYNRLVEETKLDLRENPAEAFLGTDAFTRRKRKMYTRKTAPKARVIPLKPQESINA